MNNVDFIELSKKVS